MVKESSQIETDWTQSYILQCRLFGGNFLIPNDIDRVINVYYHLATTQYFTDGNKRTACLSLKVNFEELGYEFEVKDTILADLTMKVATDKISEEECRKIIRKYLK